MAPPDQAQFSAQPNSAHYQPIISPHGRANQFSVSLSDAKFSPVSSNGSPPCIAMVEYSNMETAIAVIGKLCAAAFFNGVYTYAAEIFPTAVCGACPSRRLPSSSKE
eukprot:SAG11_NODE_1318_length_5212_cov_3.462351_6_plen_107_part_00